MNHRSGSAGPSGKRKVFREVDAKTAMSEHEIAQAAFSKNRERLKAERLAREAAATPPTKAKHKRKRNEDEAVDWTCRYSLLFTTSLFAPCAPPKVDKSLVGRRPQRTSSDRPSGVRP
jgi:hypothetical protein